MLLHGWIASADLNWWTAYDDLRRAPATGCWRSTTAATAADCARWSRSGWPTAPADAAAALRALGAAPAIVVGYSMGGAIGQLVARDHPDVVSGLVLSGTAQHWQESADPPLLARNGRARAGAVGQSAAHLAVGLSPRRAAGVGGDRVAAVRADSSLGARHRRGRTRAGAFRLAAVAASAGASRRRSWSHPATRRAAAQAARARSGARARRCSRPRSSTSRSRRGPRAYNPALLEALACRHGRASERRLEVGFRGRCDVSLMIALTAAAALLLAAPAAFAAAGQGWYGETNDR